MNCLSSWFLTISAAIALGPVWILLIIFALWCAGFTVIGVAGGSFAAVTQSKVGLVPAGSCFACLQSLGAGGVYAFQPVMYVASSFVCLVLGVLIMHYWGCHLCSECVCH
mmetsp:Transcript_19342/g.28629  ORF Transcript_19342/g.28629 Transcript_19342/m.28629 type:complete len:110 (-) Transcript_19342:279-608(-)